MIVLLLQLLIASWCVITAMAAHAVWREWRRQKRKARVLRIVRWDGL